MSVWVEILLFNVLYLILAGHAPRERVSWNTAVKIAVIAVLCHAPRERVSWNYKQKKTRPRGSCHAPRERVSWNICHSLSPLILAPSRSTWACELKSSIKTGSPMFHSSRSTWACELKLTNARQQRWRDSHAPRERVSWNFSFFVLS